MIKNRFNNTIFIFLIVLSPFILIGFQNCGKDSSSPAPAEEILDSSENEVIVNPKNLFSGTSATGKQIQLGGQGRSLVQIKIDSKDNLYVNGGGITGTYVISKHDSTGKYLHKLNGKYVYGCDIYEGSYFIDALDRVHLMTCDTDFKILWRTFDENGVLLTTKKLTDITFSGVSMYTYMEMDSQNNLILMHMTADATLGKTAIGKQDMHVLKYNSDGTLLWHKQFGKALYSFSYGFSRMDEQDNIYIGYSKHIVGHVPANWENHIAKIAPNGDLSWQIDHVETPEFEENFMDLAVTPSGDVYVASNYNENGGDSHFAINKFNVQGELKDRRTFSRHLSVRSMKLKGDSLQFVGDYRAKGTSHGFFIEWDAVTGLTVKYSQVKSEQVSGLMAGLNMMLMDLVNTKSGKTFAVGYTAVKDQSALFLEY